MNTNIIAQPSPARQVPAIQDEINTILEWARPLFNGKLLITEGQRNGFVPDDVVSHLAGYLKTQHGHNPAVYGEARRGYEIELGNGYVVGVTRKRGGLRRGNWLAFCRVKPTIKNHHVATHGPMNSYDAAQEYGLEERSL